MNDLIPIERDADGALVVSSTTIADNSGIQHKNVLELARNSLPDLEEFGQVAFETRPGYNGAKVQVAQLNEQQATLLLTYMRNTPPVRSFKKNLIHAFYAMAQELQSRSVEPVGADFFARAVLEAQSMLAEKDRIIEAQKPKADYVDQFVRNDDGVILRVAAQQLGIRETELRQWLIDHRWIYRKVMEIRWDKKYGVEREEAEYFPCAGKGQLFKLVPQHRVRRYRSGALRHTLNITAPGMARLASHFPNKLTLNA